MEHEHIHILSITKAGEKKLFQIKLPKNAKKITGILVTVQPINNNPFPTDTPTTLILPKPILLPLEPTTGATTAAVSPVTASAAENTNTAKTSSHDQPLFPLEQVIP